jgi:hypothetical protein
MSESDISNLISELKQLKLQELQVLATLESIVNNQQGNNIPLVQCGTPIATPVTNATIPFQQHQVGDLVVITNKIRRSFNRPVNRGDRLATITKVTPSRIDLRTDNGSHTWRAPHNIRFRLQHD